MMITSANLLSPGQQVRRNDGQGAAAEMSEAGSLQLECSPMSSEARASPRLTARRTASSSARQTAGQTVCQIAYRLESPSSPHQDPMLNLYYGILWLRLPYSLLMSALITGACFTGLQMQVFFIVLLSMFSESSLSFGTYCCFLVLPVFMMLCAAVLDNFCRLISDSWDKPFLVALRASTILLLSSGPPGPPGPPAPNSLVASDLTVLAVIELLPLGSLLALHSQLGWWASYIAGLLWTGTLLVLLQAGLQLAVGQRRWNCTHEERLLLDRQYQITSDALVHGRIYPGMMYMRQESFLKYLSDASELASDIKEEPSDAGHGDVEVTVPEDSNESHSQLQTDSSSRWGGLRRQMQQDERTHDLWREMIACWILWMLGTILISRWVDISRSIHIWSWFARAFVVLVPLLLLPSVLQCYSRRKCAITRLARYAVGIWLVIIFIALYWGIRFGMFWELSEEKRSVVWLLMPLELSGVVLMMAVISTSRWLRTLLPWLPHSFGMAYWCLLGVFVLLASGILLSSRYFEPNPEKNTGMLPLMRLAKTPESLHQTHVDHHANPKLFLGLELNATHDTTLRAAHDTTLPRQWKGDPLAPMYRICHSSWGATAAPVSALDLAALSFVAGAPTCGDEATASKRGISWLLDQTFAEPKPQLIHCEQFKSIPRWIAVRFPAPGRDTIVVSVRGTSSVAEAVLDTDLFSTIKMLQVFNFIAPVLELVPENLIRSILRNAKVIADVEHYEQRLWEGLAAEVKKLVDGHGHYSDIILTGHSLGGVFAEIVAARLGLPALVWSAPGVRYSRDYFGTPAEAQKRDVTVVMADHDLVPRVDGHDGVIQPIECRQKNGKPASRLECHSLRKAACEVWRVCGDSPLHRDFSQTCEPFVSAASLGRFFPRS